MEKQNDSSYQVQMAELSQHGAQRLVGLLNGLAKLLANEPVAEALGGALDHIALMVHPRVKRAWVGRKGCESNASTVPGWEGTTEGTVTRSTNLNEKGYKEGGGACQLLKSTRRNLVCGLQTPKTRQNDRIFGPHEDYNTKSNPNQLIPRNITQPMALSSGVSGV
jgi:hypothetical protein